MLRTKEKLFLFLGRVGEVGPQKKCTIPRNEYGAKGTL